MTFASTPSGAPVDVPPVDAGTASVTSAEWSQLRDLAKGRLITATDPDWDTARIGWIVSVDQRPAAVLEVADAADVVHAVRWAAGHSLPVAAQPRGHAARTSLNGTLLLRTGALDQIDVDVVGRTARVGAGVRWSDLLERLDGTGLVALAGSSGDPSVVGQTLGGGASWFSRKYGFAANSIRSLDVVDADGGLQHVTASSDPDLFWALRGGGGDFAIVVAMEIALFAESDLYGGRLLWNATHCRAVLGAFRDIVADAPPALTLWAHVYHFPAIEVVPEPVRGRSFVSVACTHLGTSAEAEALLAPLRDIAPVELDLMGEVPIGALSSIADEPVDPMPAMELNVLLDDLTDDTLDALTAAVADRDTCPLTIIQLRHLEGAFADRPVDGGAVCAVDARFSLYAVGVPVVAELVDAIGAGFNALDTAVRERAVGRLLSNFTGEHQDNAAGYEPATHERLQRIKRERDPGGRIRSNKPVLGA
ncbi:FAD-binding oxidoreductase [Nocardioides sp.]|uniref:FAD-binding oxidoreductase n=1 Tax=Nocardioides sp. TaxID=35761 RepID=UPI0027355FD1|nr:FAD-binding oxidoreductase [Nocardioides sp.]MDP3894718.1 FAD-binding oxidoreductase [Nocardioides sp.]